MKSQKGVTLLALTIYLIVLVIVIAVLAIISDIFYNNRDYLTDRTRYMAEYNKFAMYFIEDVKKNRYAQATGNQIIFEDGTVYTYVAESDRGIYRNKVKICNNITFCNFSKSTITVNNTEKYIIDVHIVIAHKEIFDTTNEFVLRYW